MVVPQGRRTGLDRGGHVSSPLALNPCPSPIYAPLRSCHATCYLPSGMGLTDTAIHAHPQKCNNMLFPRTHTHALVHDMSPKPPL